MVTPITYPDWQEGQCISLPPNELQVPDLGELLLVDLQRA